MDKLPSQSLSKTLLIATPLFMIVLAILNSSNQLSYLFVLKFVNNVAGQSDLTFIPTMQPVSPGEGNFDEFLLSNFNITTQIPTNINFRLPLVNITTIQQWASKQSLVKGTSPRWLIPAKSQTTDLLLLFLNVEKQQRLQIGAQVGLKPLKNNQVAISEQIVSAMGLNPGDNIKINLKISNMLRGSKLLEKFQDEQSLQEYKPEEQTFNITTLSHQIFLYLNNTNLNITFSEQDIQILLNQIYDSELNLDFKVSQKFYPSGMYASVLHNVVVLGYNSLSQILAQLITTKLRQQDLTPFIPSQYASLWKIYSKSQLIDQDIAVLMKDIFNKYSLMQVVAFNRRTQIYHPSHPLNNEFSKMLESVPGNVQVIALYPLYIQSLGIKYFFESVIQIFTFVSCLLFFYTMGLVLKQLYEQKQIEVGLWRTLGAGGIRQMRYQQIGHPKKEQKMKFTQKLFYFWQILLKVGYIYYWITSCIVSIILYLLIKWFIFSKVCEKLNFDIIPQSWLSPFVIFFSVFILIQWITLSHIYRIYTNPLVETIKPVKRTYDLVKIRIIDFSTFGISSDSLLLAVMLIYYGVTAYYFIPFAVLDNNQTLQIYLFNSIFVFMILGSVLLVSVLQSRIQVLIIKLLGKCSKRLQKLKKIMMKNIQAKQYRNIKVSLIISLIFAFLLFFSAGIKIEIRIIQSFIERALGSDLVLENYQQSTFNQTLIGNYLDQKNIKYSWLSNILNSKSIKFKFISHITNTKIDKPFKIITSNYLSSTYSKYYVPSTYMQSDKYYSVLPGGIKNGFDMMYHQNGSSVGTYNPHDTLTSFDPYQICLNSTNGVISNTLAPEEQIINLVVSKRLLNNLGVAVGTIYKLEISNLETGKQYVLRSRIVHSFKAGPGFDILWQMAFISEEQAQYLIQILNADAKKVNKKQKLFILSSGEGSLNGIGQSIVSMSPDHTQLFQMKFVNQSFSLLTQYLDWFVMMITVVMGVLSVVFLSIYTISKCRDEAEMFKILRAIGVNVTDIRSMIFIEILVRIVVSIINGVLLGIVLSLGFSKQIEQFLMINTPPMDLTIIFIIAVLLLLVFGVCISLSTRYLSRRTVLNTTKL